MVGVLHFSETIFKRIAVVIYFFILPAVSQGSPAPAEPCSAVITAERLNLRPEPGTVLPPVKILKKGDSVVILSSDTDGWLKVTDGSHTGYIIDNLSYLTVSHGKQDLPETVKIKRQIDAIHQQIEVSKENIRTYSQTESDILEKLNGIDLKIDTTRKLMVSAEKNISELEQRIDGTTTDIDSIKQQICVMQPRVTCRLNALYALDNLGNMSALAASSSISEFLQQKTYLEHILAYDNRIRTELTAAKTTLSDLLQQLETEKENKSSLQKEFNRQLIILSQEKEKRHHILSELRARKSLSLAALESQKQTALKLQQMIESLIEANRRSSVSGISFSSLRGLLKIPVKGKIIALFGPYKHPASHIDQFRSGIDIRTDRGEPIAAVSSGQIIYSNWLKNYGNMIIIDHADNYYTVYAHIEEMFKATGDPVETGEVIATVGDTGSIDGPKLYFEIRHHGKALDPLKWIHIKDSSIVTDCYQN